MPRPIADHCRRIETHQLPPPGGRIGLRWADIASGTLERDGDCVTVQYFWRTKAGEPWRATAQEIRLAPLRCHFGGRQIFFACPGCSRRARKLFDIGNGWFGCRRCGGLASQSQSQGSWLRALRRIARIRRYCGGSGDISEPFPPRPPRMTLRIYTSLREEARRLETVPIEAWLMAGARNAPVAIRRDTAGAKKRQWWPRRNRSGKADRSRR